ncbi:hypothetical protein SAY86_014721 [Trapa natans]|uniref:Pentatricopeptide repeat-containing protein n=1 Tax=Trapa natans TaxID=22666 RepID=A0AAN7QJM4_TRANT|nr:hypothetical protein SAY86_014721 [Trapa natans]
MTSKHLLHRRLLHALPIATATWNGRLWELSKHGQFSEALELYRQMLRYGESPNAFTFPFLFKSCAALSLPVPGAQLHGHVIRTGCGLEPFVLTSLITMYSQSNLIERARQVFDESPQRYLTVCFNALISGYAYNSRLFDAAALFSQMRQLNISFNSVTMLGLIPACNLPPHMSFGMSLHSCIIKFGLETESSVGNCLLTMYVKCGSIEFAETLFDSMPERGLISWNAMISGYAQNGLANKVLDLYQDMKSQGIHSDPVTLVCILSSCAHLGAHSIGRAVEREIELRGFGTNSFLNNALINMYSRCGKLGKARAIFDAMSDRTVVTWTAIMNGTLSNFDMDLSNPTT